MHMRMTFGRFNPHLYREPSTRIQGLWTRSNLFIMLNAFEMLPLLKKIHENEIRMNVTAFCSSPWLNAWGFNFSRRFMLARTGESISPRIWYSPFNPPQMTKENPAPCHKPLIRNTTRILIYGQTFPYLLPPKGINK